MQRRRVGQEIVAHKETKENEVINNALEIKEERKLEILELQIQVLSNHVEFDELELDRLC